MLSMDKQQRSVWSTLGMLLMLLVVDKPIYGNTLGMLVVVDKRHGTMQKGERNYLSTFSCCSKLKNQSVSDSLLRASTISFEIHQATSFYTHTTNLFTM